MNNRKDRQAGYSLAEMLTVVAIVGVMTLVTVPAFVSFYQSNKVKTSMRSFTSDLRRTRQRAITTGKQTMLSFETTSTTATLPNYKRKYYLYEGNLPFNSTSWTRATKPGTSVVEEPRSLDDIMYFPSANNPTPQTFTDVVTCSALPCTAGTDGKRDIIFFPDGRVSIPAGNQFGTVTLRTEMRVPIKQYAVQIQPSGSIKLVAQ
jgi:prepilin-type N-terminal cleavage/methylation domain-containing protein